MSNSQPARIHDRGNLDDFRGNQPRSTSEVAAWMKQEAPVEPIDPKFPIVDPHHHLFGGPHDRLYYRREDLQSDLNCGHRVIGTVYVEAYDSGWRTSGPEEQRPVGETEMIVGLSQQPLPTEFGSCDFAAGIVCHADLGLGAAVEEVLAAHVEAGRGRVKGLRQRTATVEGIVGKYSPSLRNPELLADNQFREGFAKLRDFDFSFDSWIYHTQFAELIDLVDAFPDTPVVVDHMAGPIGVAEFRSRHAEVMAEWERGMQALAERPNVFMKIGGMGMPLFGFGFEHWPKPPGSAELAEAWRIYIETSIDAFGTNRCMFESNFPVDKQSTSYASLWNAFKLVSKGWSQQERADVFFGTACRVYRLPHLLKLGEELAKETPR